MKNIRQLISLLSSSDKLKFISFLELRNKRKDAKNIELFHSFLNGNEGKTKGLLGENAFYVAVNRLTENLIQFISDLTFKKEATEETNIIKLILLGRRLIASDVFDLGIKLLKKANHKAKEIGHYSLSNEANHTLIQYSYLLSAKDQELLFRSSNNNLERLIALESKNLAHAKIKIAFQQAEFKGEQINLNSLIENYKNWINVESITFQSFEDLLYLVEIIDTEGTYKKNYSGNHLIFKEEIERLKNSGKDTEQQLPYYIKLLYLIANIYFRKKNFKTSLQFLSEMKEQMERYGSKFYKNNQVDYFTLKALNLNFLGEHEKAYSELEKLFNNKKLTERELLKPTLVLIMVNFQQSEFKKALKLFADLQESDRWYKENMGLEWLLNKRYIEILLHIELNNLDYVDSCINNLLRSHSPYFKEKKEFQIIPFLKLVKMYYRDPTIVTSVKFEEKVETSINWKPLEEEDIFLMCFYAWLKSKMVKQPLYQVTMDLVNKLEVK